MQVNTPAPCTITMTYDAAHRSAFAIGEVPDGYFGNVCRARFTFNPSTGAVLVVHAHGYHTAGLPACADEAEALYLLRNHPSSTARNVVKLPRA